MQSRTSARGSLLVASFLLGWVLGCAHQTTWVGEPLPDPVVPNEPLPITLGVVVRSFEASRIRERAVVDRVSRGIRESGLFQGVMYPVPPGTRPVWELQLLVRDGALESDANLWKGALAAALLPLTPFLWFENDYSLSLETVLVRRSQVVATYQASGTIRHRYQYYADRNEVSGAGLELVFDGTLRQILSALHADAERLRAEDRARSGS